MSAVHVFTAPMQPATRWTDCQCVPPIEFRWPGNRLLWCECCRRKRPAKNCAVQSYYDGLRVWCATGKGCKDPNVIAAKQRATARRRSAGQKRRWAAALPSNADAQATPRPESKHE